MGLKLVAVAAPVSFLDDIARFGEVHDDAIGASFGDTPDGCGIRGLVSRSDRASRPSVLRWEAMDGSADPGPTHRAGSPNSVAWLGQDNAGTPPSRRSLKGG